MDDTHAKMEAKLACTTGSEAKLPFGIR